MSTLDHSCAIKVNKNEKIYSSYCCDLWQKQEVAGGGAVEAGVSVYLENLAKTLGSREQLASNCRIWLNLC